MNYLAHMFLSGHDDGLMIGNFIADAVKGNRMNDYPDAVRNGIRLHRAIDTFTDQHAITAIGRERLHPHFHKYSGVVVDMYFDHFLASNWSMWSTEPLRDFTSRNYGILARNFLQLPARSRRMLPFMVRDNWLLSYARLEHLDKAFRGMAQRTIFRSGMELATEVLRDQYDEFRVEFLDFFPEIITHTDHWRGESPPKVSLH